MRKENATFQTKFISEAGSYLTNSDYFAFVELKDYACYVAADGIDSDERKESAKLAVSTVIAAFSENPGISAGKLKKYMKAAHIALLEEATEIRLEASIIILVTDYKKVRWAHVGNCRLYWMRNGMIKASTKDTSLTQRMVDQDELSMDKIAFHEERNNLYCYLGMPGRITPVISGKKLLENGDILLLETHGVWENVGDAELLDAIDGVSKPDEVCLGLEDVILSQQMNIIENYTIAAVFVDKVYQNPKAGKNKKIIKICVTIAIVLLVLIGGILLARFMSNRNNISAMLASKKQGISYLQENNYPSAKTQFDKAMTSGEKVKSSANSKNGKKVSCVEMYSHMLENITLAIDALDKGNYKDASVKLQNGIGNANTLQDEYHEDISDYIDGLNGMKEFADAMQAGATAKAAKDYDTAVSSYDKAITIMFEMGNTEYEQAAYLAKDEVNAEYALADGDKFYNLAMDYYNENNWINALGQFKAAKKRYEDAKNDYGSEKADAKISSVNGYITSCENNIGDDDVIDAIQTGSSLEAQGDTAMANGDYLGALEFYQQAQTSYQSVAPNASAYELAINNKIYEAKIGPAKDSALSLFVSGTTALANDNYTEALTFFRQARAAYVEIDENEMVGKIDTIIVYLESKTAVG